MSWPLSQDYNEAIQDPHGSLADPELRGGEAITNAMGMPMPRSGNFADVYEFNCPASNSKWAVKCFTRQVPGLGERYSEISRALQATRLPFGVDFQYLKQGIRIRGQWYPILKMRWIEGLLLNEFVRANLDKPALLGQLNLIWGRMAKRLREAGIAHCDLQHGNVLLVPGSKTSLAVKLIDYDGMYVPALANTKSGEVGHPNYQHPQRLREGIYKPEVDRFPLLVVGTALQALSVAGPSLWQRYDNGDNLLFKETDLREPGQSAVFGDLMKMTDRQTRMMVEALWHSCQAKLEETPLIETLLPDLKATGARVQGSPPGAAQQDKDVLAFGDSGDPTPKRRKKTQKAGIPTWAWVAGGSTVAAIVVVGLVLAFSQGGEGGAPDKHAPVAKKPAAKEDRSRPAQPPTPSKPGGPTAQPEKVNPPPAGIPAKDKEFLEGDVIFLGDSITRDWKGQEAWKEHFGTFKPVNLGIGGTQTDQMLRRITDGKELENLKPKVAVIMIGTNDLGGHSAEQIANGIKAIVDELKKQKPDIKILLLGVFPRGDRADANKETNTIPPEKLNRIIPAINAIIAGLEDRKRVFYKDIGKEFLDKEGGLPKETMPDYLHLSSKGYDIWGMAIKGDVEKLLMGSPPPDEIPVKVKEATDGFVPLFNGKDLTGWQVNGDAHDWQVSGGIITGFRISSTSGPLALFSNRSFGDFHLRVETILAEGNNCSIQFRQGPTGFYFFQIAGAVDSPGSGLGFVTKDPTAPRPLAQANPVIPLKPGEWFTLEIIAEGAKLTVLVKGKKVVSFDDQEHRFASGVIQLVCRGNSTVRFRKVEITEVPPSNPGEQASGNIAGILFDKKDDFLTVKADGEDEVVKYQISKDDKRLAAALKSIFPASRVQLNYKKDGDNRQLVGIKRQVLKATGTVTGEVVKVHNDFWVEVKPKNGLADAFAPGGTNYNDKEFMAKLKGLKKGDSVTITYNTDFERHRILLLRINETKNK